MRLKKKRKLKIARLGKYKIILDKVQINEPMSQKRLKEKNIDENTYVSKYIMYNITIPTKYTYFV